MNYVTSLYDVLKPNEFIYKFNEKNEKTIYYFNNNFNKK